MKNSQHTKVPTISFIFIIVVTMILFEPIHAAEYTPPGLYDIDYYTLPNGLHVLLKERHQARTVSYRAVVNMGMADYPCGRKETPHFLEHLLFTGTSKHAESELENLVEEHGGSWNAATYDDKTVYEMNIFSKYSDFGLETLYEIITDSQISQENIDKSRDIIHRESGGRPSAFKQWFYQNGMGKSGSTLALDELLAGTPYVCQNLEMADDIKRSDILDAYNRYYVPNNMTLIVVGDFDSTKIKSLVKSTFGLMKTSVAYKRQYSQTKLTKNELLLTSTLSPVFGNDALVGVVYATAGTLSPDYHPLWFIEKYLQDTLYTVIRIEQGKSYSPSASWSAFADVGVFTAYADTELSAMEDVVDMIQKEIDLLVKQPVNEEIFTSTKTKLLMSIVQGYESNLDMADYYTDSLIEIETHGTLTREEDKINALSVADIQRVAKKYFGNTPRLVYHDTPTMTYAQFGFLLMSVMLVCIYVVMRYYRARH